MTITWSKLLWYLVMFVMLQVISLVEAEDPYQFLTWNVTYGIRSPLGVPQQVILINDQYPGPNLNTTTNVNVVINVYNYLDEPLLFTWNGIQMKRNSWQDGTLGTNCPILPGKNFTYHFQAKDQIGSYYYSPSTMFQKAAGGFGGLRVNSRPQIPIPFPNPEDDYTVLIGDWYTQSHSGLRSILENTTSIGYLSPIGKPNGVLINGKHNNEDKQFNMTPGKTYRYRICNVGVKYTLNFRIQGHRMKLVEIEGSHTIQEYYDSLDVHLGQCYSVLVTADQDGSKDYYMVASTRFTKYVLQTRARIHYINSKGIVDVHNLPPAPITLEFSFNQFRSFRWDLNASAARPNPQGTYHYGEINITRTMKLVNSIGYVDGKVRYGINGASHVDTETPFKLAEYYVVQDKVFKYDIIKTNESMVDGNNTNIVVVSPIVIDAAYRRFVEIIFENHESSIQFYHLDGYAFFPVAMDLGRWSPEDRNKYNLIDAVPRSSIQVYPKSWTAILLMFDNAGMWNLRSECLEKSYLGQQLYFSVRPPRRDLKDEFDIPSNALHCGIVKDMNQTTEPYY